MPCGARLDAPASAGRANHATPSVRYKHRVLELVYHDITHVTAGSTLGDDGAHAVGAHVGERHRGGVIALTQRRPLLDNSGCKGGLWRGLTQVVANLPYGPKLAAAVRLDRDYKRIATGFPPPLCSGI